MNDLTKLKEQYEALGAEIEALETPEFEYPIFKRANCDGTIVKFTGLHRGIVVCQCDGVNDIGYSLNGWTAHTDTDTWEDVAYDRDRDLYDTQPVMCWDDGSTHDRKYRFYDAKNSCTFTYEGIINGNAYDYYEAIPLGEIPEWMKIAQLTLKI